jgi:protein-glutamine gamma-glutamyltransferase
MTRLPPFLLAAALLFWGWQTGLIVFAVVLALVFELPRIVSARWDFTDTDFRRFRDLTAILIVGALVYRVVSRETSDGIMDFFRAVNFTARNRSMQDVLNSAFTYMQWMPLLFLPLPLAQAWSSAGNTPFHIYSYVFGGKKQPLARGRVDVAWPYFLVVMVAGCSANTRSVWFYPVLCVLLGWALWATQPRRTPKWAWVLIFAAVVGAGHWGHHSIRGLQSYLDNTISNWIANLFRREPGLGHASTAMGSIGRMKLSGRIVMRVEAEGAPPALLRDSSFDQLRNTTWLASRRAYTNVPPVAVGTEINIWPILPDKPAPKRITITQSLPKSEAWLSLPHGTARLTQLTVGNVETNFFGFTRVTETPGLARFTAEYGPGPTADHPPAHDKTTTGWDDLEIPHAEREVIHRIARELGLHYGTLKQRVRAIEDYFSRHFTYTTWLKAGTHNPRKGETAVGRFLTTARSGHCEYFASATVLLLREAGIPARYATGYSVQEKKDGKYIIRERHAHAWTLYWDEDAGVWKELDTTPGGWSELEAAEHASMFEPLKDFFSDLWHRFNVWRVLGDKTTFRKYVLWIIAALILYLVWRLFSASKRARRKAALQAAGLADAARQGADSAFYAIERKLSELGWERRPSEPLAQWLARIERLAPLPVARLRPLLTLHYRYRFDPLGLDESDLQRLASEARRWLDQLAAPARTGEVSSAVR